jgi:hypothetical protein
MNDMTRQNLLMLPVQYGGREYLTSHRLHADYRGGGGEKYTEVSEFNRMIRSIEAYQYYRIAQNIIEISAKSQVIENISNPDLGLLIKSNSYKPVILLDKTANVAVMNFLENEASRQFAVQGNTYLAEKLTVGPSLEDFMMRTESMFKESLINPLKEVFHDMKAGMLAIRGDVSEVKADIFEIKSEVSGLKTNVQYMGNVIRLHGLQMDKITASRRRGFSSSIIQSYIRAIAVFYNNNCPCCQQVVIVDNGLLIPGKSEKDHFHGRHLNKLEDGWVICLDCHIKKTHSGRFCQKSTPAFNHFHDRLSSLPGIQPEIPGILA